MILTSAGFLTGFGFILWIAGLILDKPAVGVIGAIFVVGVGANVVDTGLEVKTGEVHNNTSASETTISYQYSQVPVPNQLPLGGLWMLVGGVMVLQTFIHASQE